MPEQKEGGAMEMTIGDALNLADQTLPSSVINDCETVGDLADALNEHAETKRQFQANVDGNALKAISRTDDELVVGNYLVVFGGRDLEGIGTVDPKGRGPKRTNADGSIGEYFTKATKLESSYTDTGRIYVDWDHGFDPTKGAPGKDDVLGYVDWKTAKTDDKGVWVERVLNRRNAYMQWLEELIDAGLIGNSTETMRGVQKAVNGEILAWPLKRDTLTVTPAEPRMMNDNTLSALKHLAEAFPHVKSLTEAASSLEAQAEAGLDESPAPDATAVDVNVNINISDERKNVTPEAPDEARTEEVTEMSEKTENVEEQAVKTPEPVDVEAIVKEAVNQAAAAAVEEYRKTLENEPPVGNQPGRATVKITDGRADRELKANPYKSFGEFLQSVSAAGSPYDGNIDQRLLPLRSKDVNAEHAFSVAGAMGQDFVGSIYKSALWKAPTGLSETVPADGGFLVGTQQAPGIMSRVYDVGQLLQRVDMTPLGPDVNAMTFNAEDEQSRADGSRRGGIRGYWAAEAAEKTATQPKFRQMELKLRKVIGLVYATDELLADATALEAWILQNLPEELRFVVEDAIVNGTGAGQPQGILNSNSLVSVAKETGQAAATIVAENVMKMWARRWVPAQDYVWLVNQDIGPQLWQMSLPVGTGGVALYMPPGGLSAEPYGRLMNRPVLEVEYAQTLGTVGDIILASLGQFQMIEKGGVEAASSIHVRFVYDETCFRFVYRVDGESKWNEALTPKNGSNSVSPFVSLATRA